MVAIARSRAGRRICLVRLSALGDVSHILPIVHTLRMHAPEDRLTWIVGRHEASLLQGLDGVELIEFDKSRGLSGYFDLRQKLGARKFDVLLQMQVSIRANCVGRLVDAPIRIGFDPNRSRDLHGLFINHRIAHTPRQHVLDAMFSFLQAIDVPQRTLDWTVPIPQEALRFAESQLPGRQPTLVISPCSSTEDRNWSVRRYVELARYVQSRHGMRVVLCGGPTPREREYGRRIEAELAIKPLNLIGKDTLKRFVAVLQRADLLVSPDSGPAHIAACTNTPVVGLYAVTDSRRCGPYPSLGHCVDRYQQAAKTLLARDPDSLRWGARIAHPRAMDLVLVQDVTRRIDRLLTRSVVGVPGEAASGGRNRPGDNNPMSLGG